MYESCRKSLRDASFLSGLPVACRRFCRQTPFFITSLTHNGEIKSRQRIGGIEIEWNKKYKERNALIASGMLIGRRGRHADHLQGRRRLLDFVEIEIGDVERVLGDLFGRGRRLEEGVKVFVYYFGNEHFGGAAFGLAASFGL